MSLLSIKNLNKFTGEPGNAQHILKGISLSVECGEFVAIMGHSGSGKSTLLNILGCLDIPSSGEYLVNGVATAIMNSDELADLRRQTFGFIFQRYNLLESLSVQENVALPAIYADMPDADRMHRAQDLLASLEMRHKSANKPHQLSGGQQQRVSIARALMNGGKIILADEPTGALDTQSGKVVLEIFKQLNRDGHTIIMVTHDISVAAHAGRIIELRDGEVVAERITQEQKKVNAESAPFRSSSVYAVNFFLRYKSRILECLKMALQSIFAHKLRSVLTMLGIIIGTASVIFVVALGKGSQEQIINNISRLGSNNIRIYPGKGWGDRDAWRVKTLTEGDVFVLGAQNYLSGATPQVDASGTVIRGNITVKGRVNGINEQGFTIEGKGLIEGRFYTATETVHTASVTVVDEDARDTLFPHGESPLGEYLFFEQRPLQIIGVIKRQFDNLNKQDSINIWSPHTTVMRKIAGKRSIDYISVKVADGVSAQAAEKNIEQLLAARHGKKDFFMFNVDTYQKAAENAAKTTSLLIYGIASVSLLVGGIGVMNIMLVTVTERTAEVGLRMAIGARRNNVLAQFLSEAVVLCLLGGSTGIGLAFGVGIIAGYINKDINLIYSSGSILLALFCASGIGIIFGYIPARNASRLNPIQALARD
jgi:macrolide transport system ATP-binding/permease protein